MPARLAAAIAVVLAVAAVVMAIVLGLASGSAEPASGAARLVPADALLYLHVSTDPSRPDVRRALARAQRLPGASLLTGAATGRLDAILGGGGSVAVDFATDVRPWLGREAALAVLDTAGSTAGTLIVLDVRARLGARAFLAAHGAVSSGDYRGVALLQEPSGTTLAFLGHFLVCGQVASVEAAIDVARGARSLADSGLYQQLAAAEPTDRVLDVYAPGAGVARALLPSGGLLGALGTLLYQPALRAAAIAVSPAAGGYRAWVHSVLDPKQAGVGTAHAREVTASLAGVLPAGTMMMVDAANLRGAAAKLLAAASRVGVAARAADLLVRLGGALISQGVSVNRLFAMFGSEAALAVVPGSGGSGPAPVLVGRSAHPAEALTELSNLEGPLTQAFTPSTGGGLVPEVGATTIGGATVSQLTLAPGLELDWAVSHGLVVLSTSGRAVASVIRHQRSLSGERAYQNAVGNLPKQVTSLVFFDLGPLLRLGEQTGLIGGDVLTALLPDLEQARAIGLASTIGNANTTTQLQLQIP